VLWRRIVDTAMLHYVACYTEEEEDIYASCFAAMLWGKHSEVLDIFISLY